MYTQNNLIHILLYFASFLFKDRAATSSVNKSINDIEYPNTFYNRTVKIGDQDIVFRVVNGRAAKLGEVPYQVAVMMRPTPSHDMYTPICGGSIIGSERVLTAAHCLIAFRICYCFFGKMARSECKNKFIRAGHMMSDTQYQYKDSNEYGQWRKITGGRYPKHYLFPFNDIAVVYTDRPFTYNEYVSPIPYASKLINYKGNCLIAGFGRMSHNTRPDRLLVASVEIIPYSVCNRVHKRDMTKYVCTSDIVSDVHHGDSGGPIVCSDTGDPKDEGQGVLVGVACGMTQQKPSPSFFTRVASYYNFINKCSSSLPSYMIVIMNCLIHFIMNC